MLGVLGVGFFMTIGYEFQLGKSGWNNYFLLWTEIFYFTYFQALWTEIVAYQWGTTI